jgi:hypothetical protein
VADEEALFVVVSVDKPTSNTVCAVAADFAGIWVEHIDTVNLHPHLTLFSEDGDVRLAEDNEEVTFTGVLEIVRHVQIGIHPCLEHRNPAKFVEFSSMGFVVERASNQNVKPGIACFTRCCYEVGPGNGAEFRPDKDCGALLCS